MTNHDRREQLNRVCDNVLSPTTAARGFNSDALSCRNAKLRQRPDVFDCAAGANQQISARSSIGAAAHAEWLPQPPLRQE
jgi:hypothetical protein